MIHIWWPRVCIKYGIFSNFYRQYQWSRQRNMDCNENFARAHGGHLWLGLVTRFSVVDKWLSGQHSSIMECSIEQQELCRATGTSGICAGCCLGSQKPILGHIVYRPVDASVQREQPKDVGQVYQMQSSRTEDACTLGWDSPVIPRRYIADIFPSIMLQPRRKSYRCTIRCYGGK